MKTEKIITISLQIFIILIFIYTLTISKTVVTNNKIGELIFLSMFFIVAELRLLNNKL